VVDTSITMLDEIDSGGGGAGGGTISKWTAAEQAISAVLGAYPAEAQYGLMLFPGAAGECTVGEVVIDVAAGNASLISTELSTTVISGARHTPAGQSLMAASQYNLITENGYANHVIFITDGHQYCSVDGGTHCVTAADCALMGIAPQDCPTCMPQQPDGCYCVQDWPVLGAQALANNNVTTYVVGFGSLVNCQALNQAAIAGGTDLPNCDPVTSCQTGSTVPRCYYQSELPAELTAAFGTIVQQTTITEACVGDCGIAGTRTCTVTGWSACDAPTSIECISTCQTVGTQECINGQLTECSSEVDCVDAGAGAASASGGAGGAGLSGAGGMAAAGGTDTSQGSGTQNAGVAGDPDADSGCGCRTVGPVRPTGLPVGALLLGALGVGWRRCRRSSAALG